MPYPNFHAARIKNPELFARIRVLKTLPNGVMIYGGPLKSDPSGSGKPQAYRFPKKSFTVAQAKTWLKEHDIKYISFEKATGGDSMMDSVQRYDVMDDTELFLTRTFKKDSNGFLSGDAIVTNIGVFTYKFKDGRIIRELRPPEEVLHPDSLATLKMKPMTNNHPDGLVDVDNIKDHQVGTTGSSVWTDAYAVAVPLSIQNRETIRDVEEGKVALSCGYTADLEYTPGVWGGVEYDAIQRNIRYNHVAIVDRARAGDLPKIRMDGTELLDSDGILVHGNTIIAENNHLSLDDSINNQNNQNNNGGNQMSDNLKKIKLDDGVEYQADVEVVRALTATKKALKDAEQVKTDFENYKKDNEAKLSKVQADLDTANDQLKKANDEIAKLKEETMSDEAIQTAIDKRIEIVDVATKINVEVKKDMKNLDIKKAIIIKVFPDAKTKLDEKKDDEIYIDARYDSAVEIIAKQASLDNKKKVFGDKSKASAAKEDDGETNIVEDAYAKYIEDLENSYKNEKGGK